MEHNFKRSYKKEAKTVNVFFSPSPDKIFSLRATSGIDDLQH